MRACHPGLAVLIAMALGGGPVAWAQTPPAGSPAAGDAAAGEQLFLDRCTFCHVPEGGGQGPSLKGVYGRKAASAPGFAYSAALKASGVTWTGPELDRYLTNPSIAIPGSAMPLTVPDAKERADLIAYLAAQHSTPPPLIAAKAGTQRCPRKRIFALLPAISRIGLETTGSPLSRG